MRTRLLRIPLALGLLAGLISVPATAEEPEPCTDEDGELVFEEVVQWVKAPDARLGNLGAVSEATGQDVGEYPTWNDEEPTASVTAGAGGGSLQQRAGNPAGNEFNREVAGHFEGTFTGCMDTIAWDLYLLSPVAPIGGTVTTIVRLLIDDTLVFAPATNEAPAITAPSAGTGLYRMRFAFTGIHDTMSRWPQDFAPLEDTHTIEMTLFSQFVNDAQGMYVYDTTESPSHLTFNKAEGLGDYTLIQTQ